jgi:hypothetical protein
MSDFRSKVEEIQCDLCNWKEDGCDYRKESQLCPVVKVTTDRILAAYKAKVEGITIHEQPLASKVFISEYQKGFHWGLIEQLEACKKYMLEGLDDN